MASVEAISGRRQNRISEKYEKRRSRCMQSGERNLMELIIGADGWVGVVESTAKWLKDCIFSPPDIKVHLAIENE